MKIKDFNLILLSSVVPARNSRPPPEIARVSFSTRTKLPGGFGGPGGGFCNNRNSGKATTATTTKKTPPGPPKPPGNLARVENHTRAISGAGL